MNAEELATWLKNQGVNLYAVWCSMCEFNWWGVDDIRHNTARHDPRWHDAWHCIMVTGSAGHYWYGEFTIIPPTIISEKENLGSLLKQMMPEGWHERPPCRRRRRRPAGCRGPLPSASLIGSYVIVMCGCYWYAWVLLIYVCLILVRLFGFMLSLASLTVRGQEGECVEQLKRVFLLSSWSLCQHIQFAGYIV